MRYAIVIEKAEKNYSAYVPDLPGCTTTGKTVQEVLANMRQAIAGHLGVMTDVGEPVPDPATLVDYVDVPVPELVSG
ncbi:MAG: type II toxin-antitoxin system HicB family antitoxin [Phycisphaerales bacterium]|nr:type II toxin-antitoxin system HicB family antitoxin [Phycisphaerales bacterium]